MMWGHLWLLVGSMALWMGLMAVPARQTSGQPPLSHGSTPGVPLQDKSSQKEKAKLACVVAQKSPLPQGNKSGGKSGLVAAEIQPGKEGSFPPKVVGPAPLGKLLCKKKPQLERPSVSNMDVAPPGGARPAEKPQVASEQDLSLGTRPQPGGGPVSREKLMPGGKVPLKEKPRCVDRPKLASKPAMPSMDLFPSREAAASGGKPNATNSQHEKPSSGMWKPTSAEKPIPGTGHAMQEKPIPSEKPREDGKPASAVGHVAHVIPPSGEKPASNSGPSAHDKPIPGEKPTSGEKPASHLEHEKPTSGDKPASSDKPEHGEKPAAEKESKPEKEADDSNKEEEEEDEEDDLFDDEEEEKEDKGNEEGTSDISEGNKDGDDDAFDKELDYGLKTSPFDGYSYHDAWSDEDGRDASVRLREEMAALPEAGDASSDRKPTFDVWGDLVERSGP